MTEINLLPWRNDVRKKRKINKIKALSAIALLFMLIVFMIYYQVKNTSRQPSVRQTKAPLQNKQIHSPPSFKWAGYLLDEKKFIGLITFPNGTTIDVKIGSKIDKNNIVTNIDSTGIIIMQNGKKEKIS